MTIIILRIDVSFIQIIAVKKIFNCEFNWLLVMVNY